MKLAESSIQINLSIFIMTSNNISSIFRKSWTSCLITNYSQINLILLIFLNIKCKTSIFTNPFMINYIFFMLSIFNFDLYLRIFIILMSLFWFMFCWDLFHNILMLFLFLMLMLMLVFIMNFLFLVVWHL
jgi:hypothetical protein